MGFVLLCLCSTALLVGSAAALTARRRRRPAPLSRLQTLPAVADPDKEWMFAEERPGSKEASDMAEVETVKLLITGYGPFRGYPTENPSTLTARHLDKLVLDVPSASPAAPRRRRIDITFLPIDVSYAAVDSVIPPLHARRAFDAYVHVGVASRAKDGLRLERRGRRGAYDSADSEGQYCRKGEDGRRTIPHWAGMAEEEELWSSLDTPALLRWLQADKDVEHVRLSDDAGLYLCEYIYATSLNACQTGPAARRPTPVLFVHVPDLRPENMPPSDDLPVYTELEVAEILKHICGWVGARASDAQSSEGH